MVRVSDVTAASRQSTLAASHELHHLDPVVLGTRHAGEIVASHHPAVDLHGDPAWGETDRLQEGDHRRVLRSVMILPVQQDRHGAANSAALRAGFLMSG